MPRGKQLSIEEKLQRIDDQISVEEAKKSKIDEKIKALNDQKKAIFDEQQQKKVEALQEFIDKSGKSPDEIMAILKEKMK
jgi:septal ring factor EnvC (AmiA/AmiB activator)